MEIWKDIPGYEGCYQISTHGRVKTLSRVTKTGRNGFYSIKTKERILKPQKVNGYYHVWLSTPHKPNKRFSVHRLVARTFIPNPDNSPIVGHNDDNKLNNRVENIYWTTPAENNIHNDIHIRKGPLISAALKAKYAAGFKPYLPTKPGSKESKEVYID